MNVVDAVVLAAYASLLLELTCFPIPSEASTWQLLATRPTADDPLAHAHRRPLLGKVLRYLLPTAIGMALFLVPLGCVVLPVARERFVAWAHPGLALAGAALIVAGRGITFTSVLQLRRQRRLARGAGAGLFAWSRNPGLVGMFVCYLGLAAACGAPIVWLGAPLYFANMHQRVLLEEAHRRAIDGPAWSTYAARVPRYLPLPGLR